MGLKRFHPGEGKGVRPSWLLDPSRVKLPCPWPGRETGGSRALACLLTMTFLLSQWYPKEIEQPQLYAKWAEERKKKIIQRSVCTLIPNYNRLEVKKKNGVF